MSIKVPLRTPIVYNQSIYSFGKKAKKEEKKKPNNQDEPTEGNQTIDLKPVESQMNKTVESFK
jgi:hypothetical protein